MSRDALWQEVYEVSRSEYTEISNYEDYDARLTADAAAAGWYSKSGWMSPWRKKTIRGLPRCPSPGNLLNLTSNGGTFLSVEFVDAKGKILTDAVEDGEKMALLWSDTQQALYIFPNTPLAKCEYPPTIAEARLNKVWAQGRAAKCSSFQKWPNPSLPEAAPGICVSYRSDKFKKNGRHTEIDYIHHFGPGVVVYRARCRNGSPEAIVIKGGKLRLTEHGIDG